MAGVILAAVASAAGTALIQAARNYSIRYGPQKVNEGDQFVRKGYHKRDFVRLKALQDRDGFTEEEYLEALGETQALLAEDLEDDDLMHFSDDDEDDADLKLAVKESTRRGNVSAPKELRIRVFCMKIRGSRDLKGTEAFAGPIPLFAHWGVEVDGVFYELRDARNNGLARAKHDGRQVLYTEMGNVDKNIKLEITTNRKLHESTTYFNVGKTMLNRGQIIRIAALIFRRFGEGYDIWMDNCQLFAQLLAEAIAGKENAPEIRRMLNAKSLLKFPIVASWVAAPAYHLMAVLHHTLPTYAPTEIKPAFAQKADEVLAKFENFLYHPRVYAGRRGD